MKYEQNRKGINDFTADDTCLMHTGKNMKKAIFY